MLTYLAIKGTLFALLDLVMFAAILPSKLYKASFAMGLLKDRFIDAASSKTRKLGFSGETYNEKQDRVRLTGQYKRVRDVMADGYWRTLEEISLLAGAPPQSVSARLRDLRKERFGSHHVERRSRGDHSLGIFEYRLIMNAENQQETVE